MEAALVADEIFIRRWHKLIPPKLLHETFGVYNGVWLKEMDRYWESNDGYSVCSRKIKTEWGTVEHVTIQRLNKKAAPDIPWAVKQQIKDELFGAKATAIEVFPSRKHLIDVCDIYHLWVLPDGFQLPFGIHPIRDPICPSVGRGYDFDQAKAVAWSESVERKMLVGEAAQE